MLKKTSYFFKKIFFMIVFLLIGAVFAKAEEAQREYVVKTVFLYNFVRFVSWDDLARSEVIKICALASPEHFRDLLAINGKKVQGRNIIIRNNSVRKTLHGCNVIFISRYGLGGFEKILAGKGHSGILTVSDIEGFAKKGGIIEMFTTDDNKIRFRINFLSAEKNRVKISSELLRLAIIVEGDS